MPCFPVRRHPPCIGAYGHAMGTQWARRSIHKGRSKAQPSSDVGRPLSTVTLVVATPPTTGVEYRSSMPPAAAGYLGTLRLGRPLRASQTGDHGLAGVMGRAGARMLKQTQVVPRVIRPRNEDARLRLPAWGATGGHYAQSETAGRFSDAPRAVPALPFTRVVLLPADRSAADLTTVTRWLILLCHVVVLSR